MTVLGIVVGVATVIAMVSIVTGFNNNMVRNFQSFGASLVMIQKYEPRFGPGGPRPEGELRRKDLTLADADAIREQVPEARAVSPQRYLWDNIELPPEVPRQRGPVAEGLRRAWSPTPSPRAASCRRDGS